MMGSGGRFGGWSDRGRGRADGGESGGGRGSQVCGKGDEIFDRLEWWWSRSEVGGRGLGCGREGGACEDEMVSKGGVRVRKLLEKRPPGRLRWLARLDIGRFCTT